LRQFVLIERGTENPAPGISVQTCVLRYCTAASCPLIAPGFSRASYSPCRSRSEYPEPARAWSVSKISFRLRNRSVCMFAPAEHRDDAATHHHRRRCQNSSAKSGKFEYLGHHAAPCERWFRSPAPWLRGAGSATPRRRRYENGDVRPRALPASHRLGCTAASASSIPWVAFLRSTEPVAA
jgi:hypothetical protein